MILQALQSQNPGLYRELEQANQLQAFAENRAEEALAAFDAAMAPERTKLLKSNLGALERVQAETSAQRRVWASVLPTFLEFQPPPETTESNPES
jgi:transposase